MSSRSSSSSSSPGRDAAENGRDSRSASRSRNVGLPISRSSRSSSPMSKRSSRSRSVSSRSSRSRSPRSAASSSRSRSRSPARSSSRSASSRSSSPSSSSRSPSPEPVKSKLKVKIKGRTSAKASRDSQDSSDEEEEVKSPRKGKRGKNVAAKSPKKGNNKAKKGAKISEEGEVSSEGSAKEFDDGLDDDFIGDEEDRARLENMTEKEREEELFKRAENRENLKKRFEIQKKLKHQQKLKGDVKTSSEEEEEEEGETHDDFDFNSQMYEAKERSQDRKRNLENQKFDKKSTALNELKAKRQELERKKQEKKEKREQEIKDGKFSDADNDRSKGSDKRRKARRESSSSSEGSYRRRSSSSSSSSSSRSGSDSETERFQNTSRVQKYVETQEDLRPICLSRFKMEKFLHLPFFKDLVCGCYVRIGIGQHEGRSVYRCTEVVDVVETAKVYHVGKAKTNIGLRLKFGKQERVFRLEFLSNSSLTPTEFEKWKQTCLDCSVPLPSKDFVTKKGVEIRKALSYEFSSADVDRIIEKKEKFNKTPVNYAMHKAKLMKEKEIALGENDHEKAAEIESQLQMHEQRAEELDKRRTENTRISSISLINNRNRQNNILKAEQAIQEEIRRKKSEGVEANPFTRRKCNPRMVTKASGSGDVTQDMLRKLAERQRQEKENRKAIEQSKQAEETTKRNNDDNTGSLHKKPKLEDPKEIDISDAHNFDIDIDVDTSLSSNNGPASTVSSNPVTVNTIKPLNVAPKDTGPTKRSLNLIDYKKKRGLI